ncbi:(2Fe-2S)-binding protein [Thermoproteus tenax]|uniref:Carbon monoxide dehydrogenase, small subunit n=2 Tax=Thermoproteus tenax TaxID=2271 RepID=G4RN59_THETK|nr:(2Fe-2S)-binding protein [Thermoproteus tenax]CAF18525.1 carbon monoxide dehydrogenase small subunit CoxS/CutS homologues [Thermoproteus tenax]CCC81003.1 carbon monoxide dehydrogenase, small subunit [Thermoproteus tenax Kra 1]
MRVRVKVNGVWYERDVEPRKLLVHFLRDDLGIKSVRVGCDTGNCGACTVLMNGLPVKSCNILAVQADGGEIITADYNDELMTKLKEAFHQRHALQCGFCTSGMLTSAYALLKSNPRPSEEEIREAISGVLCRCTGYQNIVEAVKSV